MFFYIRVKMSMTNVRLNSFDTMEDVKRWIKNPEINPYSVSNEYMSPLSEDYDIIYEIAFDIAIKHKTALQIKNTFPKNHVLFGNIDLLYYRNIRYPRAVKEYLLYNIIKETTFAERLTYNTILEKEFSILKNRFSDNNLKIITENYNAYIREFIKGVTNIDEKSKGLIEFINFLEKNTLNNGIIIIKYIEKEAENENSPEWIKNALRFYKNYKSILNKTISTKSDIMQWIKNPKINPYTGEYMIPLCNDYIMLYELSYDMLIKEGKSFKAVLEILPKNHILFGDIDLILYYIGKKSPHYNIRRIDFLYDLIAEYINGNLKETIAETELDFLKTILSDKDFMIKLYNYKEYLIKSFINNNYDKYSYPDNFIQLIKDTQFAEVDVFFNFLGNKKLKNGEIIIPYLYSLAKNQGIEMWILDAIKIYEAYFKVIEDINNYFDLESGIIENPLNIQLKYIEDPIDKYFEPFETALADIKKKKFSKLFDLTTFKPIQYKFLSDAQYSKFKKDKEVLRVEYEELKDNYDKSVVSYNTKKSLELSKSPVPPSRPKIILPNGKIYNYGDIEPLHVKQSVVNEFKILYDNLQDKLDEYNRIKDMPYLELIKDINSTSSSSRENKSKINKNILLSMNRIQINNEILNDYSDLKDKCKENIDILTNDDLSDENYPLSKLQLMVRLKIYSNNKENYRTECIYAPALYNYLIKCRNDKTPFTNPITNSLYTDENIDDLMKIMKIIDPSIEKPIYIKHRNDIKLKIKYDIVNLPIYNIDDDNIRGYNTKNLKFYHLYIVRQIGNIEHVIYNLCHIPADIKGSGTSEEFITQSNDLDSHVMLFGIHKLFDTGCLMKKYTAPYFIEYQTNRDEVIRSYIKLGIHFNNYYEPLQYIYDSSTKKYRTKKEFIAYFIHYAQELNSFVY